MTGEAEPGEAARVEAVLGLGANVGDPLAQLRAAIGALRGHPGMSLEAVSDLYETPPWGMTDQPAFLNAAARISTRLRPRELLAAILTIEAKLGRDRREKWGPRLIDIDILLYGEAPVNEPDLAIPHPHLHERAFALLPLLDVAPDARIAGRPAASLLEALDVGGIVRVATDAWWEPLPCR